MVSRLFVPNSGNKDNDDDADVSRTSQSRFFRQGENQRDEKSHCETRCLINDEKPLRVPSVC